MKKKCLQKNLLRTFFWFSNYWRCVIEEDASEASAWRDITWILWLSTQIGLTATPKGNKDVSNMDYFGKPVYTCPLKQGIDDSF
jgi:type I site-specific restriction endonuclease